MTLELAYQAADSELETGRMASRTRPTLRSVGTKKEGECSLKPTLSERIGKDQTPPSDEEQDWMKIEIYVPPGDRNSLQQVVDLLGFVVVDWCLWERPSDRARLLIGPVPVPPPHGFES